MASLHGCAVFSGGAAWQGEIRVWACWSWSSLASKWSRRISAARGDHLQSMGVQDTRMLTAFELDGQRYERAGTIDCVNRNGATIKLVQWRTECPECHGSFVFAVPRNARPEKLRRRCTACSALCGRRRVSQARKGAFPSPDNRAAYYIPSRYRPPSQAPGAGRQEPATSPPAVAPTAVRPADAALWNKSLSRDGQGVAAAPAGRRPAPAHTQGFLRD